MHLTLTQAVDWIAVGGGAWAIVRAGAAKGVLRVKAPARCAACGRQKVRSRCPCTDNRRRLRWQHREHTDSAR
jgi:hypothetical protein